MRARSNKLSSEARRGLMIAGKRRYGRKFRQRKHHGAQRRYRNRQGTTQKRSASLEMSPVLNQEHNYMSSEDFKAGFIQGYEDGIAASSSW